MSELSSSVSIPNSLQEIEQAIKRYRNSDVSGAELLRLWEAIRDASLNQTFSPDEQTDQVAGDHSY
ncbi:hypothetical protein NG798_09055 [Ancylothrix sp. C2]|uniref:hypothetical protein n=1 Tax=Ancylothrix sp. D3o TaxID=2953691 RepID=UPI0021BB518F|nr:hypothetical protein [Ancylothrix sp. D3o]MCT7949932.1 hypothetical protein [Ancylothrix sp. D3o]